MRATFATAVLVTASLMAAVALTSAQNSGGDQEKGLTGSSGGKKSAQPEHWDGDTRRSHKPQHQAKKFRVMTSSKLVTSLLQRVKTQRPATSSHRAKHEIKVSGQQAHNVQSVAVVGLKGLADRLEAQSVVSPFACCAWPQGSSRRGGIEPYKSSRMAQVAAAAAAMREPHVVAGMAFSGYRKRVLANKRRPLTACYGSSVN